MHDWLYEYVYKEMYLHVMPGNKLIARATVLLISALFHEIIITVSTRMFYPVLFILFFFAGTALTFVKVSDSYIWHILFLYGQCFGKMLVIIMYTMKYKITHGNVGNVTITFP